MHKKEVPDLSRTPNVSTILIALRFNTLILTEEQLAWQASFSVAKACTFELLAMP